MKRSFENNRNNIQLNPMGKLGWNSPTIFSILTIIFNRLKRFFKYSIHNYLIILGLLRAYWAKWCNATLTIYYPILPPFTRACFFLKESSLTFVRTKMASPYVVLENISNLLPVYGMSSKSWFLNKRMIQKSIIFIGSKTPLW